MTFLTRTMGVALVVLAGVVVADAARAATAMQQCAVAKLRAAGKEVGAKMVCYAKAKKAATVVDPTCLMNAQTKADVSINSAKADGACAGTATDIDAAVDGCVSAFLTDDPGNGACPALSAKVIGKGAKWELVCQAKDLTKPGTFAACDMAEDAKTTVRLGNAGGGTPCVSITSVMTDIDNCNTAIALTVTTTTVTTTTVPGPCVPGQMCGPCAQVGGNCLCATQCGSGCTPTCIVFDNCGLFPCPPCTTDADCPAGEVCGGTCTPGQGCAAQAGACGKPCPSTTSTTLPSQTCDIGLFCGNCGFPFGNCTCTYQCSNQCAHRCIIYDTTRFVHCTNDAGCEAGEICAASGATPTCDPTTGCSGSGLCAIPCP